MTALEIPEPEHLESLVSIPFRSHFAEFDMSYESLHLDKSGIIEVLAKFIDAMIICPDPLLSENQACELKSRLEKEDPKLLEVYRKYTLHQDVSQLVIAILGVLDFSEEHTEVTLQEKCLKCIQSPPVSQFFAEKELHYIRILISEDHPQILLMFQKFSSDGQVNEFVTGLKKIISAGMSASLEGNNYQPNEIITFLKDLEVKKRLQTEEINILLELVSNEEPLIFAAYNSYLLDKDEDDFIETLSVMSKMQIMKPEAIDRILCQVEEDHQCFNENEMDILKTLIKDENDVTYAAFSLFLEDGDVNDLIETLQLLATQHSPLAVKSDVRGVKMRSMQISPLKIESEASQTTQSDEEEENEEEEDEDESNNGHDEDDDFDINAYSELSKTAQSDILKSLMAQPLTGLHEEDQIPE